jgi:hypothetical protein
MIFTVVATEIKSNNIEEICDNDDNLKIGVEPAPEISCISKIPKDSGSFLMQY